jgi:hypothetical protein
MPCHCLTRTLWIMDRIMDRVTTQSYHTWLLFFALSSPKVLFRYRPNGERVPLRLPFRPAHCRAFHRCIFASAASLDALSRLCYTLRDIARFQWVVNAIQLIKTGRGYGPMTPGNRRI